MEVLFRKAIETDLIDLVNMLADDFLGSKREDFSCPINSKYKIAFDLIDKDPHNELIVFEVEGTIAGMFQLTFIPYLTHIGSWRCMIEGVRIHTCYRGKGLGETALRWAIERAKNRGCQMVQLTSDKKRKDALRFYEKLGFTATHEGFKMYLSIL